MIFYKGQKFTIKFVCDAETSLVEAESHVPTSQLACKAQLRRLMQRLADTGSLNSPEQLNKEMNGIFAIKARCGLRAYGWFHAYHRGVCVISHFIFKTKQKLDPADIERAERNRRDLYTTEGHIK